MRKMGNKSESFSRQALQVVNQNPQIVPASIPVADAIADIKLLDQLRPRWTRMSRLTERGNDTDAAFGNDIMTVALQAYGLLKLTGRAEGMETLRRYLSGMFNRSKRAAKPANEADAAPRREAPSATPRLMKSRKSRLLRLFSFGRLAWCQGQRSTRKLVG